LKCGIERDVSLTLPTRHQEVEKESQLRGDETGLELTIDTDLGDRGRKIHGATVRILSDFSRLCLAQSSRTFAAVKLLPPFENGMS
jgi:hypothetical protein